MNNVKNFEVFGLKKKEKKEIARQKICFSITVTNFVYSQDNIVANKVSSIGNLLTLVFF